MLYAMQANVSFPEERYLQGYKGCSYRLILSQSFVVSLIQGTLRNAHALWHYAALCCWAGHFKSPTTAKDKLKGNEHIGSV